MRKGEESGKERGKQRGKERGKERRKKEERGVREECIYNYMYLSPAGCQSRATRSSCQESGGSATSLGTSR